MEHRTSSSGEHVKDVFDQETTDTLSGDDSSIEEDGDEVNNDTYSVNKQLRKFESDKNTRIDDDNTRLSFLTHAFGIRLLYDNRVQERYNKLKKTLLKGSSMVLKSDGHIRKSTRDFCIRVQALFDRDCCNQECDAYDAYETSIEAVTVEMCKKKLEWLRNLSIDELWFKNIVQDKFCKLTTCIKSKKYIKLFHQKIPFNPPNSPTKQKNQHKCMENPLIIIDRKVLENKHFDFSSTNVDMFPVEFLAHLRLHNRSDKRLLLNSEQVDERATFTDTKWTFFNTDQSVKLVNNVQCKYPYSRYEIVVFDDKCGKWESYDDIVKKFTYDQVKPLLDSCFNLKRIDESVVRATPLLANLWYLLFGCEVIRNPASLVHTCMFLDLVRAKIVDWSYDGIDAYLPMAASGMIGAAMHLNSIYKQYMPRMYTYQPAYNDSLKYNYLVEREGKITLKWLKFKRGADEANHLLKQSRHEDNAVDDLWALLDESLKNWGF